MNKELMETLQTEYQYAIDALKEDKAEAKAARDSGDMARYFDVAINWQYPDVCWALEKWDEAKRGYRQNASVSNEARAWHTEHSGADYPIDELSDRVASTLVMAGDLDDGREHLKRAVAYWRDKAGSRLTLTRLGLHAAQVDLAELANYATSIIDARQELPGGKGKQADQARKLLHYEPAQVNLMLGRWDQFQKDAENLSEAERLVEGKPGLAFPEPLQNALVAASRGLTTLAAVHSGKVESKAGQGKARQAFEEAMSNFYLFSGQVDWNLYFMRLNTRFADELAAGKPLNPNPFADG